VVEKEEGKRRRGEEGKRSLANKGRMGRQTAFLLLFSSSPLPLFPSSLWLREPALAICVSKG
jgi:hypothetical protein